MTLFAGNRSTSARFADPMSEINTTPLIDVLLVLLIMFIIAIPAMQNSLPVDLPQDCTRDCPALPRNPVTNKITFDEAGAVRWNGQTVDGPRLVNTLAATKLLAVEPELQFEPSANASYATSAQVLALIEWSGVSNFGIVGNERYRRFDAD